MGRQAPYIPTKNANFMAWFNSFKNNLVATPASYGLTSADAAVLAAQYVSTAAAYAIITSPGTKTKTAVSTYNNARLAAMAVIRPYAQMISKNPAVPAAAKITLGINPNTSRAAPIPAPTSHPILSLIAAFPGTQYLRYSDSIGGPTIKAKPAGVQFVQIYSKASAVAITDPNLLNFTTAVTKSPFVIATSNANAGLVGYYAARYLNANGLIGPWSPIVSRVIQ